MDGSRYRWRLPPPWRPMLMLGTNAQRPRDAFHRVDPHGALDRKLVAIFIAREVIDDVIARGVAILNRRHHSAGN